ncbi:hypothetical protein DOC35_19335 [Salmonella enterica subsp. enterica]|nr:hypothetical protein [Salmonella enterica subsp. enterica]
MAPRRKPLAPTGRRHTRETINAALKDRRIELIDEYTHAKDHLRYRCEEGHEWEATINATLYQGRGCPQCKNYAPAGKEPRALMDGRPRNRSYFVFPPATIPRPKK